MYRIKVYGESDDYIKLETEDEDDLRDMVDEELNDLENGIIKAFTVSKFKFRSETTNKKWWDKK